PAAGELFDRRNRIFGLGIDGVSRAEFFRLFQLFVDDVDGDDRIGAEAFEKLDRIEPDPTAADDERGIAGRQFTHVFNRIVWRRYPATDHPRLFQASFMRHFASPAACPRTVFGETADVPTGDRRAVGF